LWAAFYRPIRRENIGDHLCHGKTTNALEKVVDAFFEDRKEDAPEII